MTLISLLLVLLVERVTTKSKYWQAGFYTDKYLHSIQSRDWFSSSSKSWVLALVIFVPVIIVYLVVQKFAGGLLELVISTAILMVCVGCPTIRATYKCFLQAANRGDLQACSMYEDQISGDDKGTISFGLNLVWQNYRHYTAVILWFAAFGAAGAILYVLVRELESKLSNDNEQVGHQIKGLLNIVDWIPVRITALGFLLVGHFSRAFPTWLGYLPDPAVQAKTLLLDVSKKAEEIEPDENDCTEEPCTLVRLAKRNVMFLLVIIALLTLTGWID
ncbi:beta-lactamase regulator AmpE [Paraglaciecola sp. MB-3u-78]|jgi:AmpE protein|uniref:beta-lactamase regulator AmpE n=1 Tax=Paraglaciecola sp. MB-3u-78 TaxID=2058332 RepID=UPI000C3342A0|nr:beta-lactamase regulator AmpE [Paraglaciecola sp. MB-3u-78]PKG97343.1 regulatory signaling modulator protein AmpE [Paraglaciecola sp. MB-3u-78]